MNEQQNNKPRRRPTFCEAVAGGLLIAAIVLVALLPFYAAFLAGYRLGAAEAKAAALAATQAAQAVIG